MERSVGPPSVHQDEKIEAEDPHRPVCADQPWKRIWKFKIDVGHRSNKWREKHFRFGLTLGVHAEQLKRCDVALLLGLADRAGPSGKVIYGATKKAIGGVTHVCERTVGGSLQRLREAGWIEWHHNQERTPEGNVRQKANTYRLLIPAAVMVLMQQRWDAAPTKTNQRRSRKSGSEPGASGAGRSDRHRPVGPAYELFEPESVSTSSPAAAAHVEEHLDMVREALRPNKAPP